MSQFQSEESFPWHCQCSRLNKKTHEHCPQCKRHWTTGQRHETQPAYQWQAETEQPWHGWESPRTGRTRARSKSQRSKMNKGKGKGRRQDTKLSSGQDMPPSPFLIPSHFPPWPTSEAMNTNQHQRSLASSASFSSNAFNVAPAPASDLLLAVRKQYPDISKAPADVREAVEKEEANNSQRIGSDLHKASSQINKATKQLNQLREARSRHREQWLKHLRDSIVAWENQMKAFKEQQKQYIDQTNKAKSELSTARRALQNLNKLAGLQTNMKAEAPLDAQDMEEGTGETEETEAALVRQVQDCLKQAAAVVNPTDIQDVMDSDEEEEGHKSKRPRSLEPFPPPSSGGATARLGGNAEDNKM